MVTRTRADQGRDAPQDGAVAAESETSTTLATLAASPLAKHVKSAVAKPASPACTPKPGATAAVTAVDTKTATEEKPPALETSEGVSVSTSSKRTATATTVAPSPSPRALRSKLKVVIPPVPPFLHEVDLRNERERKARLHLHSEEEKGTTGEEDKEDEDADYHTPEKQQRQSQKRKSRSALDEADDELLFQESEYRMSQITPPPSERMLDHKNPPQPPRKAKKRRRINRPLNPITGRMTFTALSLPRLSSETSSSVVSTSSPPRFLDTPPGSPRSPIGLSVFRSLADEFAAVQDTPPLRTLRAPPRITRAARQCTPPISSRTRGAIQTPTSTMVLRSRQLNPSKTL